MLEKLKLASRINPETLYQTLYIKRLIHPDIKSEGVRTTYTQLVLECSDIIVIEFKHEKILRLTIKAPVNGYEAANMELEVDVSSHEKRLVLAELSSLLTNDFDLDKHLLSKTTIQRENGARDGYHYSVLNSFEDAQIFKALHRLNDLRVKEDSVFPMLASSEQTENWCYGTYHGMSVTEAIEYMEEQINTLKEHLKCKETT